MLEEQANCILTPTTAHKIVSFTERNAVFQINKQKAAGLFNSLQHQWLLYVPPSLRSAHTVYICVLYGSENKQRLFPYTALPDWLL